jgi:hypothetical protein
MPWIIFTAPYGTPLSQDSAEALRILRDQESFSLSVSDALSAASAGAEGFGRTVVPLHPSVPAIAFLPILLALSVIGLRQAGHAGPIWLRATAVPVLATALLLCLHVSILGGMRDWYSLYPVWAFWLALVPLLLKQVHALVGTPALAVGTAAVMLAALLITPIYALAPQEADKRLAALAMQTYTNQGGQIASFNAGVYNFFSRENVLNIDGVVNPTVHHALKTNALCDYLISRDVQFVLDNERYINSYLKRWAPNIMIHEVYNLSDEDEGPGNDTQEWFGDYLLVSIGDTCTNVDTSQ